MAGPADGLSLASFVGFSQNHDQVGNRAVGERLEQLAGPDAAMVAAALVLAAPFVPLLFQGEEWAASTPFQYFTDHEDPALGRAVSEGRRREFAAFGWAPDDVPDPQDPATLDRSRLDWSELAQPRHAAMLDWYRRLIALRRELPGLRDGRRPTVRVDAGAGWIALDRDGASVVANLGRDVVVVPWPGGGEGSGWHVVARSTDAVVSSHEGIVLPPQRAAVIAVDASPGRG